MTEIAVRDVDNAPVVRPTNGTLAVRADQTDWDDVQLAALAHIGIADAPTADQKVFMHVCQRTGLDPWARQIYLIGRREKQPDKSYKVKWTIQTGIDGFRAKAGERPEYRGQVGPQWCGDDGEWRDVWVSPKPPTAARVGILRDDFHEPIWGTAMFREYAQTTTWDNQVQLTKMWREKGAHMIAKCAEALGLRRAFPDQLSGLYTDDEMGHLDSPREGRRVRTVIDQAPATAAELTGRKAVAAPVEQPTPGPAPAAPPATPTPVDAPAAGRMSAEQQKELIGLLRDSDIDDRWGWVSGTLGRDVSSYGHLTGTDAGKLTAALRTDAVQDATVVEDEDPADALDRARDAEAVES